MKTFIRGNQAMIQTNITEEDYNKYKGYGVFTAKDEKGEATYKVTKSDMPSMSSYGIQCNTVYQGKLTLAVMFDCEQEDFIAEMQPRLLALKEAEAKIEYQIEEIKERLEGIENTIIVEE